MTITVPIRQRAARLLWKWLSSLHRNYKNQLQRQTIAYTDGQCRQWTHLTRHTLVHSLHEFLMFLHDVKSCRTSRRAKKIARGTYTQLVRNSISRGTGDSFD
jgi:hypothetical protein